ncbi:MAG: phosphatidylglycerophosphatase A [Candidatus Zixiibacteriota bacterium]|nr:MAG: phosphatidylglycerophosphatase A [candidate division Zixibacteria bacterium]
MAKFLTKLISTGLFSGYLRPFPGTWGTIPAWLIAWFLIRGNQELLGLVVVLTTLVSWGASHAGEKLLGHDSRKIVIDEWAGMFIALLFVPHNLSFYIAAFVAFRVFDVIKLWPARQLEKLEGGLGITMDDVAAGIQANIFVQIVIYVAERLQ